MNNDLVNDKYKKKYALLVALMVAIQFINSVVVELIGNEAGVMSTLFLILFIYYFFIIIKHGTIKFKLSFILIALLISTYYIVSYLLYSDVTSVSITFFLCFCLLPYLVMNKPIDAKLVITYVVKISIIGVPVASGIFNSNNGIQYDSISMGMSYAILPVIISSFVHFMYYRSSATLWVKIAYIVNLFYFIMLFSFGNRGVILSLLCAAFLVYLIRFGKNEERVNKNINLYILQLTISSIITLLLFVNLQRILEFIYNTFAKFGINLAFLSKTYILLHNDNVDNGRIELIQMGIKGFVESPLWGNGIGVYGYNNKISILYPHNLFVQLLYDGGLILSIPIIYFLFSCTIRMFRTTNLNHGFTLFILLFSTSIPRLMVSADIWKVQSFWMLLGFLIVNFGNFKLLKYKSTS